MANLITTKTLKFLRESSQELENLNCLQKQNKFFTKDTNMSQDSNHGFTVYHSFYPVCNTEQVMNEVCLPHFNSISLNKLNLRESTVVTIFWISSTLQVDRLAIPICLKRQILFLMYFSLLGGLVHIVNTDYMLLERLVVWGHNIDALHHCQSLLSLVSKSKIN